MSRLAVLLVTLALIIVSCAPRDTPSQGEVTADDGWPDTTRPDIPRTNPTITDDVDDATAPPPEQRPVFLNETHGAPRIELDVPLGDAIGQHHPLITVAEFPLLKHPPVRLGSASLLGYEEEIRFDFGANSTGKVLFGKDDDDAIGTFLLFQEDKPILEYRLRLNAGTFADIQGREIQILGHRYLVAEASNTSVHLYGVDVPSNLAFTNGTRLVVNSSGQPDTTVQVTPGELRYTLYAGDPDREGILLAPGDSLSAKIPRNRLASRILDIAYVGAPSQDAGELRLDRTRSGYRISVETIRGLVEVPLVEEDAGQLVLGSVGEPLRLTPCAYGTYCIAPGDLALLTSPLGASYLITYADASNDTKELIIREGGNRYSYRFVGEPGQNAFTDIVVDGYPFRARIGPRQNGSGDYNITIDQGFTQGRVELVTRTGAVLRIGDINGTTVPLDMRIPAQLTLNRREERISLNVTLDNGDGRVLIAGNLTLVEDDDDDLVGVSQYGVGVFLDRDGDDLPDSTGREVALLVPESVIYGVIALEG